MDIRESKLRRSALAAETGALELANALRRGLRLLHYQGKCKCGLMLTERDRSQNKQTYRCPHCGASGRWLVLPAVETA
jgi:hypothetical protein